MQQVKQKLPKLEKYSAFHTMKIIVLDDDAGIFKIKALNISYCHKIIPQGHTMFKLMTQL